MTDPPYSVNYQDRSGRSIRNDQHPGQVLDVFSDLYRVLKADSFFATSFYSWKHADAFIAKWRHSGLTPVGHMVFCKTYASARHFVSYSHECAYLLAKGQPQPPSNPITDVLRWHYSGNHHHPSEKSVETIKPIIKAFTKAGDVVLDPFAGSGSTLVAAALIGRQYIGVELEEIYCSLGPAPSFRCTPTPNEHRNPWMRSSVICCPQPQEIVPILRQFDLCTVSDRINAVMPRDFI